MKEKARANT